LNGQFLGFEFSLQKNVSKKLASKRNCNCFSFGSLFFIELCTGGGKIAERPKWLLQRQLMEQVNPGLIPSAD